MLLPGPRENLVDSSEDRIALFRQRAHTFTQLIRWNGDEVERVEHDRHALDLENWIQHAQHRSIDRVCLDERHDDATTIGIKLRRLHDYDEWDGVAQSADIAVNVELRHLERRVFVGDRPVLLAVRIPRCDGLADRQDTLLPFLTGFRNVLRKERFNDAGEVVGDLTRSHDEILIQREVDWTFAGGGVVKAHGDSYAHSMRMIAFVNANGAVPYHLGLKPQREGGVLKWKLMLSTLPIVLALLGVKLILEQVLGFKGLIDFSDVGIILTSGVFLIGFLLAGTMADYKEAEKLPADLSCTLETLEEIFVLAATGRPGLDVHELRREVLTLTDSIREWLAGKRTTDQVYGAMTRMSEVLQQLERAGAGPYASRAVPQLLAVRRSVSRIDVIVRTGFLPPAYALLEVLIVMIISLMMIARFRSVVAEMLLVPFVALVNIYMLRLIKDVDNPFDFKDGVRDFRSGEVALFPLDEYRERLAARV